MANNNDVKAKLNEDIIIYVKANTIIYDNINKK